MYLENCVCIFCSVWLRSVRWSLLFESTVGTEEGGSRGVAGTLKRAEQSEKLPHAKELP